MRLHQWAKNTLVFVPLFTSHSYRDPQLLGLAFLAFLAFGLCASGHYFLNDLLDLEADRAHRTKCRRPLASGDLPILYGPLGSILLTVAGLAVAIAFLPWKFTALLVGYLALTNLYSFFLKSKSTADVFALALLYTVRVVAGGAALAISLSSWLLAFSMFVFISLAYLKRYIEIVALDRWTGQRARLRQGRCRHHVLAGRRQCDRLDGGSGLLHFQRGSQDALSRTGRALAALPVDAVLE